MQRYATQNLPLSELEHRPFPSILDPYKPWIDSMLALAPLPASTLYDWLVDMGYPGKYRTVASYVQKVRTRDGDISAAHNTPKTHTMTISEKAEKEYRHVIRQKHK